MRKLFMLLALYSLLTFELSSQPLIGRYINKETHEELNFISGKKLDFRLETGLCINNIYLGNGRYEISKDRILIFPKRPANLPFTFEKLKKSIKSENVLVVSVFDVNGTPLEGVNVSLMKEKKIAMGAITDKRGCAQLKYNAPIKDVELRCSYIGFSQAVVRIDRNKWDYNVYMEVTPGFEKTKEFFYNSGNGIEFRVQEDILYLKRLKPYCNQKDSCYEWREYLKQKN